MGSQKVQEAFDDYRRRRVEPMSAGEIVVRRAAADDAESLAELGARTFYESFLNSCRPEDMRTYLAANFGAAQQAAELADPCSVIFVAEVEGQLAGYAKLLLGEAPACVSGSHPVELARLYAVREQHGRGAGSALMRAALDEGRRLGRQTIWLGVWEHNERAKSFYLKWQFEVVGSHIFQVGDDPQNDLVMARPL